MIMNNVERRLTIFIQRYEEFMEVYHRFSKDLDGVRKTVVKEEHHIEDRDVKKRCIRNVVTDHEMWKRLRLEGKQPCAVDFDWLEARIGALDSHSEVDSWLELIFPQ